MLPPRKSGTHWLIRNKPKSTCSAAKRFQIRKLAVRCFGMVNTKGDYATLANSEKRYEESYNNGEGWNPMLLQIKNLLES